MRLVFVPKTKLGKWSVGLILAIPVFFYIGMSFVDFYEGIPSGRTIPQDIIARPLIALPMSAGFVSGITAFLTGIAAIIRKRELSAFVFFSTFAGFLMVLWCAAEIMFPH
jgi:hypothetical protein